MLQHVQGIDLLLLHAVNGWCGNWVLDRIAAFEERNMFLKGGVMLVAFWWFWFAGTQERRAVNRRRIVAILVGTVAALVIARALAVILPFRVRPMYAVGIGYHAPSIPVVMNLERWSSFPSDTAAMFVGLAFGVLFLSRRVGGVLMAYAAVWICLPRLYLGIHYASDLLVGALLGICTVGASIWSLETRGGALGRRVMAPIAALEQQRPHLFYAAAFALSFETAVIFDDLRHFVQAIAHLERHTGYADFSEGAALLLLVGAALALAIIAYASVRMWRRRSPRPFSAELPRRQASGLARRQSLD